MGQQLGFGRDIVIVDKEGDDIVVEVENNKVKVKTVEQFRNLIGKSSLVCTQAVSLLPPEFLPYIVIYARTSPSEK